MKRTTFCSLCFLFLASSEPASIEEIASSDGGELVTYTAAVLEFEPYDQWTDEGKGFSVIAENAKTISDYAKEAASQNVDIMVTPEYGLQSLNDQDDDFELFKTFGQFVPDPATKMVPCHSNIDNEHFQAMKNLSCSALENSIYLVVDMEEIYPCSSETVTEAPWSIEPSEDCDPETGYFVYNTQAVFDRNGAVIARYRKQNLYHEYSFTKGPEDDSTALFLTDFNVLFSLQICFDIVFEHPGYSNVKNIGLKDVAMSTAWVDYMPFDLADNVQNMWSRGLGVNLIVSGYHFPEKMKLGSGIYRGYMGEEPEYTYDKESGSKLVVTEVTTIHVNNLIAGPKQQFPNPITSPRDILSSPEDGSRNSDLLKRSEKMRYHAKLHEDLTKYSQTKLDKLKDGEEMVVTSCSQHNFCCNLTYQYTGDLTYMFLVFSGQFQVSEGEYPVGIQNCAVVWCADDEVTKCARVELALPASDSFGPFTITSDSFTTTTVVPGGNKRDLLLFDANELNFEGQGTSYTLSTTEPVSDLLQASLYGRWYDNDGF